MDVMSVRERHRDVSQPSPVGSRGMDVGRAIISRPTAAGNSGWADPEE